MRTNNDLSVLAAIEPAEQRAVNGGGLVAYYPATDSALAKYLDDVTSRLSPTPVIGPDRVAKIGDPLAG